jgi:hypothetical protein
VILGQNEKLSSEVIVRFFVRHFALLVVMIGMATAHLSESD